MLCKLAKSLVSRLFKNRSADDEIDIELKLLNWPLNDVAGAVRYIRENWDLTTDESIEVVPGRWVFYTGGWSHNEYLIRTFERSTVSLFSKNWWIGSTVFCVCTSEDQKLWLRKLQDRVIREAYEKE